MHAQPEEDLSAHDMANLLALIEVAHDATTKAVFRQSIVHGVGALIESSFCSWTELGTDLFDAADASTHVAEVSTERIRVDDILGIFNALAHQHPVIRLAIEAEPREAVSISDTMSRVAFNRLALYTQFYRPQGVEDQLSIGFIENGQLKGVSVQRGRWGFSRRDKQILTRMAACTFAYYRSLPDNAELGGEMLVVLNRPADPGAHHALLGLTPRQAELLSLVARGLSNKQIAAELRLSEGTVRKHLENGFRRLGVRNRVAAIAKVAALTDRG